MLQFDKSDQKKTRSQSCRIKCMSLRFALLFHLSLSVSLAWSRALRARNDVGTCQGPYAWKIYRYWIIILGYRKNEIATNVWKMFVNCMPIDVWSHRHWYFPASHCKWNSYHFMLLLQLVEMSVANHVLIVSVLSTFGKNLFRWWAANSCDDIERNDSIPLTIEFGSVLFLAKVSQNKWKSWMTSNQINNNNGEKYIYILNGFIDTAVL